MSECEKELHTAGPTAEVLEPATPKTALLGTPFDTTLEEHLEIRRSVQEITDLLSGYRVGMDAGAGRLWMAGLAGKLFGLRERLLGHFREEEKAGLYEALNERIPYIVLRTKLVRDEHMKILDELGEIQESLTTLTSTFPLEPKLLQRTLDVLYRIVCHERKESDLIACAFQEELGRSD